MHNSTMITAAALAAAAIAVCMASVLADDACEADASAPEYVTLVFQSGGAPAPDRTYVIEKGTGMQLPSALFSRQGHHLAGYVGLTPGLHAAGTTVTPPHDATFTAVWEEDPSGGLAMHWDHDAALPPGQTVTLVLDNGDTPLSNIEGYWTECMGNSWDSDHVRLRTEVPGLSMSLGPIRDKSVTFTWNAPSPGVYPVQVDFVGSNDKVCLKIFWTWSVTGDVDRGSVVTLSDDGAGLAVTRVDVPAGRSIRLPALSKPGHTFDGWYTAASGGQHLGGTFTPSGSTTVYARFTKVQTSCSFVGGPTYTIQTQSGAFVDYVPRATPPDATVSCISLGDLAGKLTFSGGRLHGQLSDVLPVGGSGYPVRLRADSPSADLPGYQTVYIRVTTTFMPTIEAEVAVGTDYIFSPSIIPSTAQMTAVSVTDNATGASVPPGQYSVAGLPGKTLTFRFSSAGVYKIAVSASSVAGTATKVLLLRVFEPTDTNPPTCGEIVCSQDAAVGGAFAFSVSQPAHYTSITWDFGDGGSASGQSVSHAYTTTGSKTVRCTVHNTAAVGVQTVVRTAAVTVDSLVRLGTDAWAGCPYDYSFSLGPGPAEGTPETAVVRYIWEAHYSDDGSSPLWLDVLPFDDPSPQPYPPNTSPTQTWLSARSFVRADGTAALRLFSDGPQASLAGKVLVVTARLVVTTGVESGLVLQDDEVRYVEIAIWPKVDVGGGPGSPSLSTEYDADIEGMTVRMRPASMTAEQLRGVRLFVDWGEGAHGTPVIQDASLATHTYLSSGQYTIKYYVKYNAIEPAMRTHTVMVPAGSALFDVIFVANAAAATGSMANLTGANSYTVPDCAFSLAGESFLHWNTAADGGGTTYRPGDTITSSGPFVRLYAIWSNPAPPSPGEHAVVFDPANGGGGTVVTVADGDAVPRPPDPSWDGHAFAGWYLGDAEYDFSAPVTSDIVLAARWTDVGGGNDVGGPGHAWYWWAALIVALVLIALVLFLVI